MNDRFLILAGTHKSGTTSLFRRLSTHPYINPSKIKETHFFTPFRFGKELRPVREYFDLFPTTDSSKINLEASPSYFYGGEKMATLISDALEGQFYSIILLRNPVDRLISFYNHAKFALYIPSEMDFSDFLNESMTELNTPISDTPTSRAIREGYYIDYLPSWEESLKERNKIVFFDDLLNRPQWVYNEIFNWLGIEVKEVLNIDQKENVSRGFQNQRIHKIALKINRASESLMNRNPRVKEKLKKVYAWVNEDSIKYVPDDKTKEQLLQIYKDKNQSLKAYLNCEHPQLQLPNWL